MYKDKWWHRISQGVFRYSLLRSLGIEVAILKLRIAWIVFLGLGFATLVYAQDIPVKFSYLTVDNGLSHTDTKEVRQDSAGFIWIATLYGLSRYDGYTVKKFYNSNYPLRNAANNRILSLDIGDNGMIWLATEGGIQCFDSKKQKYHNFDLGSKYPGGPYFTKISLINKNTIGALQGNEFKLYRLDSDSLRAVQLPILEDTKFTSFVVDKKKVLYLSANNGLWTFDQKLKFRHFHVERRNQSFNGVFLDRRQNLLLSAGTRLMRIKTDSKAFLSDKSEPVRVDAEISFPKGFDIVDLVQDIRYNYWISTDEGLVSVNEKLDTKRVIRKDSFVQSVNTNALSRLFIDRGGCLWTCTYGAGVNFCDLHPKLFYTIQHNPQGNNTLSGNVIKAVVEESNQKVWIGTNANGLNEYDLITGIYRHYGNHRLLKLKSNQVNALVFDQERNLWVGTGNGIDIIRNGKPVETFEGIGKLPLQPVTALSKDYYGNIWFSLRNNQIGCVVYNMNRILDVHYLGEGHVIEADSKIPQIMVATTNGVKRYIVDKNGLIIKTFNYTADGKPNTLSSPYTWPIKKQNDSTYWIGTLGGGLNQLVLRSNGQYSVKSYGSSFGVFNDVESLEIDAQGKIWMGGNGLQYFDPVSQKLVQYDQKSGLQSNSFKVGASHNGKSGRMYFGGINGLNYFYPDSIKGSEISVKPVFTNLVVNNKPVDIGQEDPQIPKLNQILNYSKGIDLSYLQNNFAVYFSSMQFSDPISCKYRYKLTGYDTEWKYTDGTNPSASYTNLDYGSYLLLMEATNQDGVWGRHRATLNVSVSPPWWKSGTAKIIYSFLVILLLAGIYFYQGRWYRLKSELAVKYVEEQKREAIHQQREEFYRQQLDFFTNISHEFRTPLTLILGPLEALVKEAKQSVHYHSFEMMHRNAKRLLNLISELMNFRKLADAAVKLDLKPVQLDLFLQTTYSLFEDLSETKNIQFNIIQPSQSLLIWLDKQVLEKILFNVLTNAFKYTSQNGHVTLEILYDWKEPENPTGAAFKSLYNVRFSRYIYFRIADTGIGISSESIEFIFDRYYRVSNNHLGSGIGLSLVKKLTYLHQGDIYVYSQKNQGTEIIIAIPRNDSETGQALVSGVVNEGQRARLEKIDYTEILPFDNHQSEITNTIPDQPAAHVLLVEDNDELRYFLKDRLKQDYIVYEAVNGEEGYKMTCEKMPDLVISDVMMPIMNGVELCQKLKSESATSHIPFIMLSARETLEAQLLGLESGADYYFPKPLSVDMLLLTVHNVLIRRQKLKIKYTSEHYMEASERVHSSKEKEFMEKVVAVIENNLQTPSLDVEFICQNMFISRTKLYQKVHAITGQSVGDLIRTVRLKKAMFLLTHEDISIAELTARIGYTSTSYFSSAFKKEFGKSPSQYLQTIRSSKS